MKTVLLLICAAFIFNCGGTPTKQVATAPPVPDPVVEKIGPPWENFDTEERLKYINKYACVKATEYVQEILTWPLLSVEEENPDQVSEHRYVKAVAESPNGSVALVQYRKEETGVVVEIVVTTDDFENRYYYMNYEIIRAFDIGATSPTDPKALNLAAGDYFCVYSVNPKP